MKILAIIMSLFVIIALCFVVSFKTVQGSRDISLTANNTLFDNKANLSESLNGKSIFNTDLKEIIIDSQYLTFAFDRILLDNKVYSNENPNIHNICKTTLNNMNEDIEKLMHTHYRQKLANYITDNIPSLKFHYKIILIDEVELLWDKFQKFLKKVIRI
ncbi:hypothetical protein NAPIS_ORF01917 [Vairimorpha apis BRL 01]|uniref:Uncharacterized protein n=1 Tax=Vairimorpha apis BRL 01 TaxID=1037528 RepID=T0L7V9_9MICR|nr:hypothetical protein NAPIS_ORF01917 [Vairimorpha apis BRL 01]